MARTIIRGREEKKYPYPSRYGSHRSMVRADNGDKVICRDEFGDYETTEDRLDNGLADPNRYSGRN